MIEETLSKTEWLASRVMFAALKALKDMSQDLREDA